MVTMALCFAASFVFSSVTAAKFSTVSGEVRPGISNGAGGSSFCRELTASGSTLRSSRSDSWGSTSQLRSRNGECARPWKSIREKFSVRATSENEVAESKGSPYVPYEGPVESKGLAYDGPGRGGQWLSSTTRHVRIYIGIADPETKKMDQTQLDKVTLMLDPDNEFIWPEDKVQKVYDYFAELVEGYAGAPMTEYTLRLIGSDVEHYIRKLLLGNEIKYNLDCRVLNFSMGKPRYESGIIEELEE